MNPDSSYKKLLNLAQPEAVPAELVARTQHAVAHAYIVRLRIRTAISVFSVCIIALVCIPMIQSAGSALSDSGFTSYISLLSSDGASLMNAWQEFGMTLVESLPVFSIATVIILISGLAYSVSKSFVYIKTLRVRAV